MKQDRISFSIYQAAPDSAVAAATVAAYEAACRQRCTTEGLDIPSTRLLQKEIAARLELLLEPLAAKERDMISRHWGISGQPESYGEIARTYHVTRQRVYEIIQLALKKLRRRINGGRTKHET